MADLVYFMNDDNDEKPCLRANKMPPRFKNFFHSAETIMRMRMQWNKIETRMTGIGAGDGLNGAVKAACLRQMSFLSFSFVFG